MDYNLKHTADREVPEGLSMRINYVKYKCAPKGCSFAFYRGNNPNRKQKWIWKALLILLYFQVKYSRTSLSPEISYELDYEPHSKLPSWQKFFYI